MNILVTGGCGFVGSHLIEYILSQMPTVMPRSWPITVLARWWEPRVNMPDIIFDVELLEGDLTDLPSLVAALRQAKPDIIFHLAAESFVPASFTSPIHTLQVNALGTVNLLEAVRLTGQDPRIVVCSSPEVYGDTDEVMTEETPLRPVSPYALSKTAEDRAAFMYHAAYGMKTIISRGFAHEGPGRGSVFAVSDFARQVARIEAGLQEPVVKVGNLEAVRTYCDVRDMVRAYWLLAQKGEPGQAYNIAGDEMFSLREVLDRLLALSHIEQKVQVVVEEARLRPHDVWVQKPDDRKFRQLTNWRPEIPFARTLADCLSYWRERCGPLKP